MVWLLSLAAVVAVVACGGPTRAGERCYEGPHGPADPCERGTACLEEPSGVVCTAATPCKADSDCSGDFGCSVYDWTDRSASYCATKCGEGCAAGYGCAADGTTCELRLGMSCYVTDTSGAGCGTDAACSAITRVCAMQPHCTDDSECGGFSCTGKVCLLSCTPPDTGVVDPSAATGCAPGFACNPQTFACSSTLGGPCDPGSDDGTQCGVGGACSPASRTCVSATPCTTDAECSGYGCQNGYCLLACTKNVLPCAVGRACDLDAYTCS